MSPIASLERVILTRLSDPAGAIPGTAGVFDLRKMPKTIPCRNEPFADAVHALVRRGALEWLRPVSIGKGRVEFRRDDGEWEPQVRFVRLIGQC